MRPCEPFRSGARNTDALPTCFMV